jgi:hypothetical protein
MMNHVLTLSWWESRRREAGGPDDRTRAEEVTRFFRDRPEFLGRSLARGLGLPPPRVVRVEVQGTGDVAIDGYPHRGPYVGRYFEGGTLELVVPPDQRGTFRQFTVNGRREPAPVLKVAVTDDLDVVAEFGD